MAMPWEDDEAEKVVVGVVAERRGDGDGSTTIVSGFFSGNKNNERMSRDGVELMLTTWDSDEVGTVRW